MFFRLARSRSRLITSPFSSGNCVRWISRQKDTEDDVDEGKLPPKPVQIFQFVKPLLEGELAPEDITAKNANVMITQCTRSGEDEKAFQLYDKLKPHHKIFPRTYRSLLMISAEKPGRTTELLHDIKDRGVEANALLLGGFLINMINQKNTSRALKIARQMITNTGMLPSFECTILLDHLIKEGLIDDAKDIYAASNTQYENIAYHRLITTAIDTDRYDLVVYWYHEMKNHGVKLPSIVTESVLNSFISSQKFSMVYDLAKEFSESGMLTSAMYETVFVAILRNNKLTSDEKIIFAQEYFKKFLEDKIELPRNSTLLERVLDIYISRDTPNIVRDFLEKLNDHHFDVSPSMIYRISDKFGNIKEISPLIIALLDRVKEKGSPAVRALVYSKIMNIYSEKNIPRALQYFQEMLFVNLIPNSIIYSQLMMACCESKRVKDLMYLKQQSDKEKLRLTRSLYSLIVDTLDQTHHEEKIPEIIEEMQAGTHRLDSSLCLHQRINDSIQQIYPDQELANPPRRTSPVTETFFTTTQNLMLNLYSGDFVGAEEKLNDLRGLNIRIPGFVQAAVIRFRGKNDNLESAVKYFDELENRGAAEYEACMDVFGFHTKYNEVLNLYREISSSSVVPTVSIYNYTIQALREQGQTADIPSLLRSMEKNEIQFTTRTVYELVKTYCSQDDIEKAKEIVTSSVEMFPEAAIEEIITYFTKNRRLKEAIEFLEPFPDLTVDLIRPVLKNLTPTQTELCDAFRKQLEDKKISDALVFNSFPSSMLAFQFLKHKTANQ